MCPEPSLPNISKQTEKEFRDRYLSSDIKQASLVILLYLIVVIPGLINDHIFFGFSTEFYLLAVFTAVVVVASALFVFILKHVRDYIIFDRFVFLWQVLSLIVLVTIASTRPDNYYLFTLFDVLAVFSIYVVFRNKLLCQLTVALSLSIADTFIIASRGLPWSVIITIATAFTLANALGITASWLMAATRRNEFLSRKREARAAEENRRLAEEQSRQSRLESIGVLAGSIARDFNDVLMKITVKLEESVQGQKLGETEKVGVLLKEALKISGRGKGLAGQILTFAEGGSPHLTMVSLPQIIHDACEAALQGSNVTCQYFISEGLSPVSADEVQLSQVLSNLVINARRAMPEGGIVKIKACNISRYLPPETRERNCVQIAVEDMGAGMPEAELGNIFDSCLKTGDGGFGLRLSLSYSIISKHGGVMEAQSIPGAGNIFYVYLPVGGLTASAGQTKLTPPAR